MINTIILYHNGNNLFDFIIVYKFLALFVYKFLPLFVSIFTSSAFDINISVDPLFTLDSKLPSSESEVYKNR